MEYESFRDYVEKTEDLLLEMAAIGSNGKFFFGVDSAFTNYVGNPYFKVYNTARYKSDSKVLSLSFLRAELIYHKRDVQPWTDVNKQDMKKIVDFLKAQSKKLKNHTNWEYAIIIYNMEHHDLSVEETEQILVFKSEKDPLPINLTMPDYLGMF